MNSKFIVIGGILLLLAGVIPGCGGSGPSGPEVVSEEVSWPTGDTTVYATITRPGTGDNLPAVVFVPGSGPTDRDWNSPLLFGTNGSARLLAEELAEKGYVTLRYDKRFAGPNAAENTPKLIGKISMKSHLEELQGAVEFLAGRPEVDGERVFALANSEGTIHAVIYQLQAERKLAGMILTGAPGRTVGEVARTQISSQLAGYPGADEFMNLYDEAVAGFLSDGKMTPDASLPEGIKNFLLSLANPANMPFTRELWMADIAPQLKGIDIPVLIIIGKKDIQIDWQIDGGKLRESASGKDNIIFSFPENANHVLKYEPLARADINPAAPNYNGTDRVLDPDTLETIINWLTANSRPTGNR